jgi:alkaline phosphatase D
MVTWDDHEFDNDCAGDISEEAGVDPVKFLERRANAYQAYYEMMPLRSTSVPRGPDMQLYRKCSFGRLAEFLVLDTRQYRTDQPYNGGLHEIDDAASSPQATMLGPAQLEWTETSLVASAARWNVLAQQVLMAMVRAVKADGHGYSMEKWPGYAHERAQLLTFVAERKISNPIVLTGDIHSNWVNEVRVDHRQSDGPIVATEFVGTSLSSDGDNTSAADKLARAKDENPGVRFANAERGYVRCIVTPDAWRSDFQVVPFIERPGGPVVTRASFVVESGRPGVTPA